LWCKKNLF